MQEHNDKIQSAVKSQRIIFKGESLGENQSKVESIFYLYQGRDERDPHAFIKQDPLF